MVWIRHRERAGLLHDIAIIDHEVEGTHRSDRCRFGAEKKYKEHDAVIHAIQAHHGIEAKTVVACLVQAADALSAARPGARKKMKTTSSVLKASEEVASSFEGVETHMPFRQAVSSYYG